MSSFGQRPRRLSFATTIASFFVIASQTWSCHGFQSSAGPAAFTSLKVIQSSLLTPPRCSSSSKLFGMLGRNDDDDGIDSSSGGSSSNEGGGEENIKNVEQERQRLESLLKHTIGTDGTTSDDDSSDSSHLLTLPFSEWKKELKKVPPLTAIGRERLQSEITLLESLADSNDAVPELWNLWYNARGPTATKDIMKAEAFVNEGTPQSLQKAEQMLRQIVAREGIHFVEPVNRLATLLFLQSRFKESKELCELVLAMKPWHFGALSGIVMVCHAMQDTPGMMHWARRRMPPLPRDEEEAMKLEQIANKLSRQSPDGERIHTRQSWVDEMVDKANAAFLRREMDLDDAFQKMGGGGVATAPKQSLEQQRILMDEQISAAPTTTSTNFDDQDDNAWQ